MRVASRVLNCNWVSETKLGLLGLLVLLGLLGLLEENRGAGSASRSALINHHHHPLVILTCLALFTLCLSSYLRRLGKSSVFVFVVLVVALHPRHSLKQFHRVSGSCLFVDCVKHDETFCAGHERRNPMSVFLCESDVRRTVTARSGSDSISFVWPCRSHTLTR